MRQCITPHERLSATLRYLATGEKLTDLSCRCNVSKPALSMIIPETCRAITHELRESIRLPSSPEEWKRIAQGFFHKTRFYPCVGAIDGKHCKIEKPPNSGSLFWCYKDHFSVHLLAVVDSNYKFLYCSAGANGSQADGGVLRSTTF